MSAKRGPKMVAAAQVTDPANTTPKTVTKTTKFLSWKYVDENVVEEINDVTDGEMLLHIKRGLVKNMSNKVDDRGGIRVLQDGVLTTVTAAKCRPARSIKPYELKRHLSLIDNTNQLRGMGLVEAVSPEGDALDAPEGLKTPPTKKPRTDPPARPERSMRERPAERPAVSNVEKIPGVTRASKTGGVNKPDWPVVDVEETGDSGTQQDGELSDDAEELDDQSDADKENMGDDTSPATASYQFELNLVKNELSDVKKMMATLLKRLAPDHGAGAGLWVRAARPKESRAERAAKKFPFEDIKREMNKKVVLNMMQDYLPRYKPFFIACMPYGLDWADQQLSVEVTIICLLMAVTDMNLEQIEESELLAEIMFPKKKGDYDVMKEVLADHMRYAKKINAAGILEDWGQSIRELPKEERVGLFLALEGATVMGEYGKSNQKKAGNDGVLYTHASPAQHAGWNSRMREVIVGGENQKEAVVDSVLITMFVDKQAARFKTLMGEIAEQFENFDGRLPNLRAPVEENVDMIFEYFCFCVSYLLGKHASLDTIHFNHGYRQALVMEETANFLLSVETKKAGLVYAMIKDYKKRIQIQVEKDIDERKAMRNANKRARGL